MAEQISGLTKEQTNEYNKYKKMQEFFGVTANVTIIESYPPFETEVTEFLGNIAAVEDLLPKKIKNNTGITDEKDIRKEKVAEYWFSSILSVAKAYAIKVKNNELVVNFNISTSEIEGMKDGDVQPFCAGINTLIGELITLPAFIPYGITNDVMEVGMSVANDFRDYIGKTKDANSKKTVAAGSIETHFVELKNNNIQFRLLVERFKTTQPDFYNGFEAVDVEDDIGRRHTGIDGVVTNKSDGTPIRNAVIKNLTRNKTATSSLTGEYSLIKQMPGDCEIEISAEGKKTITKIVKLKRGKIIDMNWEMEDAV